MCFFCIMKYEKEYIDFVNMQMANYILWYYSQYQTTSTIRYYA